MEPKPAGLPDSIKFGDDFELDVRAYELRSGGIPLKMKPIPMELLLFLIEHRGELVTRDQIVEKIWGKGVFLDSDNSINSAISKIRQILRDDSEHPRFVQTVTGKGYRFVAPLEEVQVPRISRSFSTRNIIPELSATRDRFPDKTPRQVETRSTNLPAPRTGFVGREKEVATAKALLLRQDVRLLTVTGPGGIGKTRLAVQVANGLAERFHGGIHYVALSSLNDPGLIASVIVQTLGIRHAGGQAPLEILKENLPESPTLLLLDNFEHLIQAAPMVAELLAIGPSLKIMVTSRAALHVDPFARCSRLP